MFPTLLVSSVCPDCLNCARARCLRPANHPDSANRPTCEQSAHHLSRFGPPHAWLQPLRRLSCISTAALLPLHRWQRQLLSGLQILDRVGWFSSGSCSICAKQKQTRLQTNVSLFACWRIKYTTVWRHACIHTYYFEGDVTAPTWEKKHVMDLVANQSPFWTHHEILWINFNWCKICEITDVMGVHFHLRASCWDKQHAKNNKRCSTNETWQGASAPGGLNYRWHMPSPAM